MGRPKTVSDEAILTAARTVFIRDGLAGSTRDIAQRVKVSQATLFQRFGDKEALFAKAMLPEPLSAQAIIGDPSELNRLGESRHVEEVAIRLYRCLGDVVPRLFAISAHHTRTMKVVGSLHDVLGSQKLVTSLQTHFSTLRLAKKKQPKALMEALLLAVHGAAFMDLTSPGERTNEAALRRLVRALV